VPFEVRVGVAPLLHDDLDEGAGLGRLLPRGRTLARRQPHDDIADAALLAGLQLDLARDIVALVEQAEHRDSLGHRRADPVACRDHRRIAGQLLGDLGRLGLGLRRLVGAGAEKQEGRRDRESSHASGVQAS